jgi:hypothetical protein
MLNTVNNTTLTTQSIPFSSNMCLEEATGKRRKGKEKENKCRSSALTMEIISIELVNKAYKYEERDE